MKNGSSKVAIIILVALLAVAIFYFISSKNKRETEKLEPPVQTNSNTPAPSSSPAPSAPTSAKTHNVLIQGFAFKEQFINIKKGDTVIWANKDSAPHTVTSDNGIFKSPTINSNGTFSFTFNNAGSFPYHCAFHPSMKATIVVSE